MNKNIAIIGGGNLGTSIAYGLVKSKYCNPQKITVTRRKINFLYNLKKDLKINISDNNIETVIKSDIIIIAVQPKQIKNVLKEIKSFLKDKILISTVTGIATSNILNIIDDVNNIPVFRVMPNTAISIRESMTCICHKNATTEQINIITEMFSKLGKVAYIDEELMSSATVLAASGIAFSMRFIRAASQGGIELGFDSETAQLIAAQTVKGAASLLLKHGKHPEKEIDKVTTPLGCTIAGLNEMEHFGFSSSLIRGIITSYNKIPSIANNVNNNKNDE